MFACSFWATVLWKRLMGKRVLAIAGDGIDGRAVRSYAHCIQRMPADRQGGVAIAIINVQGTQAPVSISVSSAASKHAATTLMEVWTLSTVGGSFNGHNTTLNGQKLRFSAYGGIVRLCHLCISLSLSNMRQSLSPGHVAT